MCSRVLGPGDSAFARYVSNHKDRSAGFLGETHQARCAFTHLTNTSRRAFEITGENRLDRIHDQHSRCELRRRRNHCLEQRLAENQYITRVVVEALRAKLHLQRRFLARDIQCAMSSLLKSRRYLEKDRGLSNSRFTADEHHRSANDSTAENEIKFRESGFPSRLFRSADVAKPDGISNLAALAERSRSGDSASGSLAA